MAPPVPAGMRRPDDDVLLQAFQHVDLAIDRGVGEDAGGFLEGRRREHRTGLQATPW